jgi:aminoglycoside phosphotransferase family enzyme
MWTPTLEEKVAFLRDPRSYDASVQQVDVRETHMSWVFLTDSVVFKLKKPVRFPYLDFTTLEKRRNACRAEVELNRRLAADVYLDAVPLSVSPAGFVIGEGVTAVDWLVKMRRLNQGRMLDSLIAEKRLEQECIEALALKLADFYRNAHRVFMRPDVFLRHWEYDLWQNRVVLLNPRFKLSPGPIRYLDGLLREFLSQKQALFVDRLKRRRIVDGHGDLRPEHIWLGEHPARQSACLVANNHAGVAFDTLRLFCSSHSLQGSGLPGRLAALPSRRPDRRPVPCDRRHAFPTGG